MTAREVALLVVRDVFPSSGRERGAQEALDYRLRKAGLDARDRAFATELAYGAIKMRRTLDWYLAPFVGERAATLAPTAHEILRLAVYELCYTRADEHATVYEFVELAKRHGHRGLASLTNAVLRGFIRSERMAPERASFEDEDEFLGTLHSLPTWLVRQWRAAFGAELLERICAGVNAPPAMALTVNLSRMQPAAAIERLAAESVVARRSAYVDESLVVERHERPLRESEECAWWVQSESSAIVVEVMQPQPGEQLLDLCSGRGNKALQIAARMQAQGDLVSVDRDERKMRALERRFASCGLSVSPVVGDARESVPAERFDRALLDAPCSGIGVVGRHPEARWKKRAGDGERLAALQAELLEAASHALYEGGALVYAVCSTDAREGVEVVNGFLERHRFSRGLVPARLEPFLTTGGDVLIPPGIDGRDGFYVARLERSL